MSSSKPSTSGGAAKSRAAALSPPRIVPPVPSTSGPAPPAPSLFSVLQSSNGSDTSSSEKEKSPESGDAVQENEDNQAGNESVEEEEGFTTVGGDKDPQQLAREAAYKKKRKPDSKYGKGSYAPGVVFSTAYYEQDYNPAGKLGDSNFTETPKGGVQSKYRKMVSVRQFEKHCVALPIFTYQGKGLHKGLNSHHHVSLADASATKKEVKHSGPNAPLLIHRRQSLPESDFHGIHPKSLVHITLPTSHKYGFRATIEGQLDDNSTRRLEQLFTKQMKLT